MADVRECEVGTSFEWRTLHFMSNRQKRMSQRVIPRLGLRYKPLQFPASGSHLQRE